MAYHRNQQCSSLPRSLDYNRDGYLDDTVAHPDIPPHSCCHPMAEEAPCPCPHSCASECAAPPPPPEVCCHPAAFHATRDTVNGYHNIHVAYGTTRPAW